MDLDQFGWVWSGLVWFGLVWFGLVWFGLVWSGLVWFGLVRFGKVWFGSVWFGVVEVVCVVGVGWMVGVVRVVEDVDCCGNETSFFQYSWLC